MSSSRSILVFLASSVAWSLGGPADGAHPWDEVERQFRDLPMEARRWTGPLFWLHGDDNETEERLDFYMGKVAEGRNGCFCTESRPHSDWLGPRWFHDLEVCLNAARALDLKMWIFDDEWWPSQTMGRKVPMEYAAKRLQGAHRDVEGPGTVELEEFHEEKLVAVVLGKFVEGGVDAQSLKDLTSKVRKGQRSFQVGEGNWRLMIITWKHAPPARQNGQITLDGASRDCVDWFIQTVYQSHYDRFKEAYGETIVGYFYDEPETQGDWGTEVAGILKEREIDPCQALVARLFGVSGPEDVSLKYAYVDALFEAWGRTLYGGITRWCEERDVLSIGHFMDHGMLYLDHGLGAGNLFQMQKYSSMGGMDLVVGQLYPGQRKKDIYQLPKLVSSISHVYDKKDDLSMCEIFGAYGQGLTYPDMKWLTDQHQVQGVNFMISHSFNPKAPNDRDCPPYFYNDGKEPRWPLYKVWADYNNRLSVLLTGGVHVCPVAFLFCGNSVHVGRAVTPEDMTTSLQDALYDCDWLPYDVFEDNATIKGNEIQLHEERYRALIVPPVEVIPVGALEKAKRLWEQGGVVLGYGFLPSKSATVGRSCEEVVDLCNAIWGDAPEPSLKACKTSARQGRSYFLAERPTPGEVKTVLQDAGICPAFQVVQGETNHWVHVLHRKKDGRDVFFVCNQDHVGETKKLRCQVTAPGVPERWDAMRKEITALSARTEEAGVVAFDLILEPNESALIVFRPERINRSTRIEEPGMKPIETIQVDRKGKMRKDQPGDSLSLEGCPWIWTQEGDARQAVPHGTRHFRRTFTLAERGRIQGARILMSADNAFILYVNGKKAGQSEPGQEAWRSPKEIEVTDFLQPGTNVLAVSATNATDNPNPAGLIGRLQVTWGEGNAFSLEIDGSWTCSKIQEEGWREMDFKDKHWAKAQEVCVFGEGPWGRIGGPSIPEANPFLGRFEWTGNLGAESHRIYVVMDPVGEGACVSLNHAYAGGIIGAPFRLDVAPHIRKGQNELLIEPYAPKAVRVEVYPRN